jgi:small-conductance mechanosensitive channel/CRP-like cAMP-binding protein
MDFFQDLAGSLFWALALSIIIYVGGSMAIGLLARKSDLLKPIGVGLKLVVLFISIQIFLYLGAAKHLPRIASYLNFFSWLVIAFAALRLGLYIYGDLFVVRWKRGSFPAAFKHIITAFILVVLALILLKEILSINVTSLIATTTVLTATIGLAFQSTLSNMLAGLTIHLEKPLKQGDWISAGGHEGRVIDITLRSTRVMTVENNLVFIPNSTVLSEAVVNYSLPDTTVMRKLFVGVSYAVPPNKVKSAVLEVLSIVPGVAKGPASRIRVIGYGDFSVQYEIRYPLASFATYGDTEGQIMNLLWYRFRRSGIDIPMPIRDVNMHHITPESLREEQEQREEAIMALLGRVEIFSPLSKPELKELVGHLRVKSYAAGEVPVRQGESGDSFYIIKSGRVDVVVEKSPDETAVVVTLGPGNFFGEMSLLTGTARTASIHVKEDAELIVIDKESFGITLATNPSIAESLSHILTERQAGLDAERERLDAAALERRKKEVSVRLLSKIRDFFGLNS